MTGQIFGESERTETAQAKQAALILHSAPADSIQAAACAVREINRHPAIMNIKTCFLRERHRLMDICLN